MGRTEPRFLPRGKFVLINHPASVANAADKLKMKNIFTEKKVPTAPWWPTHAQLNDDDFPVVVKHRMGSRGTGVYLMKTRDEFLQFSRSRGAAFVQENFVVEKYRNYRYEYRLHATREEVFFANRKARKDGVPEENRWKHDNDSSVWFTETNPKFNKPSTWEDITKAACASVDSLGLDFGAVDVKVNSRGKFFIIEVNSAPSLGGVTRAVYESMIPQLAERIRSTRGSVDNTEGGVQ